MPREERAATETESVRARARAGEEDDRGVAVEGCFPLMLQVIWPPLDQPLHQ